jgi:hypothetical protein
VCVRLEFAFELKILGFEFSKLKINQIDRAEIRNDLFHIAAKIRFRSDYLGHAFSELDACLVDLGRNF